MDAKRVGHLYACSWCGDRHAFRSDANACCQLRGLHDFDDGVPRCFFDGAEVTQVELNDSRLVGSLVRCRACLAKLGVPSVEQVIAA